MYHWEDAIKSGLYSRKYGIEKEDYVKTETKVHWDNWLVGQVYFREAGISPFIITSVEDQPNNRDRLTYTAKYLSCGTEVEDTKQYLVEALKTTETKEDDMTTRYEFTHNKKQLFGTKIAVNSSGLWVMEVKGTGEVLTVDKDKVEEVIPHSIGVKFLTGFTVYHYLAPKDKFTKGFYLLENHNGTNLVEVVDLDTKSKKATVEFTPSLKFVTEAVDNSD